MIVKEGWIFVAGFSLLGFACISITPWTGKWAVYAGILLLCLGCFSLFFFRNPERIINTDEKLILSAGDGVVMEVVSEYKEGSRSGIMVKIFLSIFDVHIQRAPVKGTIEEIQYKTGKFLPAMNPRASTVNEQNTIVLKNKKGTIEITQIAGIIARRIRCWFKKGDVLKVGQRYGLIQFGSQVDMLLPDSVTIKVKKGDRVTAGITIIGEW